jgi:NitT/TauT family transport system ATP-binding protein
MGLDGTANKYPWQLSGGMQQRVAIARALVSHPELLLLDEPFASVDALTRAELQDVLLRVHSSREGRSATVVHVTHDIDEAAYLADRVLVLSPSPAHRGSVDVGLPRPRSQTATRLDRFSLSARSRRDSLHQRI